MPGDFSPIMLGYAAGLATSFLWTFTSVFFTAATHRLGPTLVNAIRLLMAVVLLGITYRLMSGQWVPEMHSKQVMYLALSGVIGLAIGDQALFTAFRDVGPRMSLLIMTSAPIFAAVAGWIALGEVLQPLAWLGILMTMSGVAWVVLERPPTEIGRHPPHRARGIALAFVASACQAGGLMLSKVGMGHGWLDDESMLAPQPATFVRMVFAALAMIPLIVIFRAREKSQIRRGRAIAATGAWKVGLAFTLLGSIFGPFLGVWMSLEAAHYVDLGIAQTLTSLPPVLLLPVAVIIYREHVTRRAVFGAIVAVLGVAVLSIASTAFMR